MKDINRIMIALDQTPMDDTLIRYGAFIAKTLHAKMIEFVHVVNEEDHEMNILKELDAKFESDEDFKKDVKKRVFEHLNDQSIEVLVHLFRGDPFHELLVFAKGNEVDLVIVGKKENKDGTGILAQRFSSKSPCSVLFVPLRPEYRMDAIMLPTDFSQYSAMAFQESYFFREKYKNIRLLATHIYRVPLGYYKTGKGYDEFADIMERNARKEYENFVNKYNLKDLKLEPIFALSDEHNPGQIIHDIALREGADLFIIGARGHSKISSIVLGSATEKLLRVTKKIPVFVLKKKGETLKLLEILMNI